jgi:N-acyl-D-aspartate/D-glutamate deacylase
MRLDLVITGGLVVDGTGAPPARADVGIKGGRIAEIGALAGAGDRSVDAGGAIVTPGFVDLHSHYDGQVSWDWQLAPSVFHGVTTCVLGNCGVGFAPVRAADRARLVELMEGVEDIPGSALAAGLTWAWESFPEYMAAIDVPHAIDFAVQVPHDPLRVYVMGERAVANQPATAGDVARMAALLRAALEAGAAGFSTGRTDNHRSARGEATPASEASRAELTGLARAFAGLGHGVLQAVSDFDLEAGEDRFDAEFELLEAMAEAAGHPLSISLSERDGAPGQWRRILARVDAAVARGLDLRVQVAPRAIGVLLGLEATFHPFMGFPSYKEVAHLPLDERVRALREPERRRRLLSERSDRVAGDGSSVPPLADRLLANVDRLAMRLFRIGERPEYEPRPSESIGARARARGVPALEAVYEAMLEGGGRELVYFPIFNYAGGNLDAVREMLGHPRALPGLGDGGAHVGTICDASFPTFLLAHWVRDRAEGRLPLERAVRMLTGDGARFIGLGDRGRIAPGMRADLNVIDLDGLRLERPRLVADLPGGGRRLLQDAAGYVATIVAGELVAQGGALTGARPGRLARVGQRS